MQQLSAVELAGWLAASDPSQEAPAGGLRQRPTLLDVREPWEYELCHVDGSLLVPLRGLPARLDELDAEAAIVVICHHGVRSRQAGSFLEGQGFTSIFNLSGGIDAWAKEVDPAMCKY